MQSAARAKARTVGVRMGRKATRRIAARRCKDTRHPKSRARGSSFRRDAVINARDERAVLEPHSSRFSNAQEAAHLRAMKIGLYGGSFDPIHVGHLILAREARERLALDRVLFIPAALSPHKLATTPTPGAARREMVAAAVAGEPGFECEDCDLRRAGPSFAIETVRELRTRWPDAEFFYLIGHDNVAKLGTWNSYEELLGAVRFVVFGRGEHDAPHEFPTIDRRVDISATEIRTRVARGASIRYLVPESVREIIERRRLYKEQPNQLRTSRPT